MTTCISLGQTGELAGGLSDMEGGELLNSLVGTIITILRGGYDRLSDELHELMSMLIGIHLMLASLVWLLNYLNLFMGVLWQLLTVFMWALIFGSYVFLTQTFIDYCVWAGLEIGGTISGGQVSVEEFQRPSTLIDKGFVAIVPIKDFIQSHTGLGAIYNLFTLLMFFGVWLFVQFCFTLMGLYLSFSLIMLYIVTAYTLPFLVFAVLRETAFLAERAIGLFIASAVRIGALALIVGFIFPYIESFFLPDAPNPDMARALWMGIGTAFMTAAVIVGSSATHRAFAGGRVFSLGNLIPGVSAVRSMGRAA